MPIRPPPLKLKYDNFNPLPPPSARKPKVKETFFQKLYKANWRNIVVGVAALNAIRFAFATVCSYTIYNAFHDACVDDFEHQPRLVTVSIALCVMYAFSCVIEIFGVIGIAMRRMALVRAYVFFEFASALLVTVAGVLSAASFFLNAEDLMYECVALALTGQSFAKSQFRSRPWPSMHPLGLRQAQTQCIAAWTQESWTQVINVFLFGFVPALICYMIVFTYYRQTTDASHPAYLVPRLRITSQRESTTRPMEQVARNGGYTRVPNADDPYAGTPRGETNNNRGIGRSARLRAARKSASKSTIAATSTVIAATSRSLKRSHRPPALVELEGPIFTPQRNTLLQSASSPLSFLFSPGPPSFGVSLVGPSRLGIGAYGPSINLSCSGGSLPSAKYAKFV
ncbi:hypothetical protein DFP72DRAFT_1079382 [Ephemerocybe angulata]|uniref:Transmembrane protein n=1 Tax=Ephemerocybe angulata TaxID=980116 RepID=A0A8H6HBG2_9AGAR|nr:hypothetical protein DFP72DRAFT_1079382 [Tulosesus angulatus]